MIRIITTHPGNLRNNGGEYGEYTLLTQRGDGLWEVSYGSTWDGEYCRICGQYSHHGPEDHAGPEVISEAAARRMVGDEAINGALWGADISVDRTGHEPDLVTGGGCRICYPAITPFA